MRKSILVTGVAGMIGSRFSDWVVENHPEYEVVGIDNLFGGYIENINEKVVFYKKDLSTDNISEIFNKVKTYNEKILSRDKSDEQEDEIVIPLDNSSIDDTKVNEENNDF